MLAKRRELRHARRLAAAAACGLAILGCAMQRAVADQAPIPTAEQVASAQNAQADVETQVRQFDAQLATARGAAAAAQSEAANADMARHSAEVFLERATEAAAAARQEANEAQATADRAQLQLSIVAAEAFQQGSGATELNVLFGAGPQDVLDRTAGIEAVGNERAHLAADAETARVVAATRQAAAADAEQRRAVAAEQARSAAERARSEAASAASRMAALAAQQSTVTAQLATLQQTTAALEQARQDGLAAAEQARRDEAARQAGIAAAAEAARQEAARQAAQQAKEAAARRAADQVAGAARAAQQNRPVPSGPAASSGAPPLNLARADMWDRIAFCESSGNWHINTGNGYYGGLQFNLPTWTGVAGQDFAPRPDLASREEQITVANRLYAERGLQPWSCRTAA